MTQPQGEFSPKCKYCHLEVLWGPGMMMVENSDGKGFITHEECYQQSTEDEGYVERLHKSLEELDEDSED